MSRTQSPTLADTATDIALYAGGGGALSALEAIVAPPRRPRSPLAPPGPVIGMVWSALFASFGAARARLARRPDVQREIDALWLLCVTYPLYTLGMRWRAGAYAGHAAIAAVAAHATLQAAGEDQEAAALLAPVLPWVAFATAILATEKPRGKQR
jgi:tryptophan-rich sensory protein